MPLAILSKTTVYEVMKGMYVDDVVKEKTGNAHEKVEELSV